MGWNKGHQSATYLAMRTTRLDTFRTSTELESKEQPKNVSMRMHSIRAGIGTSISTYRNDEDEALEETDIEILTRDSPRTIRYTNQPSYDATIERHRPRRRPRDFST
jgi:hypothetical protein